jgi:threonyl-tRNA synthetase
MASAVKNLWPDVKLGIGPSIEDGFYYDFDKKEPFTDDDLARIEAEMRTIIHKGEPFVREEMSREDALVLFGRMDEPYKIELINSLPDGKVSVYKTGESFCDLCRGPHVDTTAQIRAFKLLSVAGAYWHGLETNPMLQRIYGTCFDTEAELQEFVTNLEEARKRDHRKIGPALGYFDMYPDIAGAGLVFYHPKGALLRSLIEDYEKKEHLKRGYELVMTPHIMRAELWKRSGHYENYRENMYTVLVEGAEYVLKPMNCPGHILLYQSKTRSYRDLPLRMFELGTVYRHEKTGVMHGLLRVRGFTQDDAHIFCLPEQLEAEIRGVLEFVFDTMNVFGFSDLSIELSTRPAKSIGSDDDWRKATEALEGALEARKLVYDVHEGEGAFYGPKIDIKLKDALKRSWQCATIQCDFALPERFGLTYVDDDGKERRPVMLHRVLLGSLERFIGALLEHYNGELPLWLAPLQAQVIPIKETVRDYADQVLDRLRQAGIRAQIDARNETLDKRIRDAEVQKIPYCLVVGNREAQSGSVAVRKKGKGNTGVVPLEDFVRQALDEIDRKNIL